MKLLNLLIMLCVSCTWGVNAQTVSGDGGVEMTVGQDELHAQLQLTTEAIELQQCSNNNLRFLLRLNFMNKGQSVVLLDKRSLVVSKYMVSRTADDAARRKYEIVVAPLIGLKAAGMTLESTPDESQLSR